MEHPVPDFHPELCRSNAKSPASSRRPGFFYDLDQLLFFTRFLHANRSSRIVEDVPDQPRVRERIMKLSKVYSATCHHRYWSER